MAENFSSGSITTVKDDGSIRSIELSAQVGADHVSLKIKQEEVTLYKMKKTAPVNQVPMLDGGLVRSVELASIADNANDTSLQVNADEVVVIYGNSGASFGVAEKRLDDRGGLFSGPIRCLIRRASHHGNRAVAWGRAWMLEILSPHTNGVNLRNRIFFISSLVTIFVDPLFLFLLSIRQDDNCLVFNDTAAKAVTLVRTLTDATHICHIFIQFRLAYVTRGSALFGPGELVYDPKGIAVRYLKGWFIVDVFTALPLPQIVIWTGVKSVFGRSKGANYAKNVLRVVVLIQSIPRSIRILASLLGWTPSGFVFESARSNFVVNFLVYLLAGHFVGACWYLFGLQRIYLCMQKACQNESSGFLTPYGEEAFCKEEFLDCGAEGNNHSLFPNDQNYILWRTYTSVGTNCLATPPSIPNFQYGIYLPGIPVVMEKSALNKYIYSFVWGFVQISSLAGNQLPSTFVGEALFTMCISALGLLLAAVLIGNIQSSLQNRSQRKMQMQLTRYDTEAWMEQRELPQLLRRRVKEAGRFRWAATGGVKEQELIDNLPEDLQEDIRRFFCLDLIKKVPLFKLLEDPVLDAIFERLSRKLYIESSEIFRLGMPVERMLFIYCGKLESLGEDEVVVLHPGSICGEELLSWFIDKTGLSAFGKSRLDGRDYPLSTKTVKCLTSVEAFSLESDGLEYITNRFKAAFQSPRVKEMLKYLSLDWRSRAATRIQTAWRASKGRKIGNLERYWQTSAATRIQKAWRASKDRRAAARLHSRGPSRSLVLTE